MYLFDDSLLYRIFIFSCGTSRKVRPLCVYISLSGINNYATCSELKYILDSHLATKMSSGIHIINRMAYVGNSNPIQHLKALHRVIASEGTYLKMKQREFYEKPKIRQNVWNSYVEESRVFEKRHAQLPMLLLGLSCRRKPCG